MKHVIAAALAVFLLTGNLAEAGTLTGKFEGQGRGCWGNLWIRTKTIQWNSDWSTCYAPYTIVKKSFEDKPRNFDYIIYKLNRPNKGCTWSYISLYYYESSDDPGFAYQWSAGGFATFQDYKNFNEKSWLTGKGSNEAGRALLCDLPNFGGDPTIKVNFGLGGSPN